MGAAKVPPKIADTIKYLVKREVGRFGVRTISVVPGEDHDGDPVIFVEINYDPKGEDIDTQVLAGLAFKVRNRLWQLGEERFPHIRHNVSDDRRLVGDA